MKLFSQTIGQGQDIVLLHGWGVHSAIWQFVSRQLSEDFRVTVIDLPGFGGSDMIEDYSIENVANLVSDVVPTGSILVGWSFGGLVATKLAVLYPKHVKKLLCVASSPKFVMAPDWPGMNPCVMEKFKAQLIHDYEATLMRFLLLQFYGTSLDKQMLRWLQLNLFSCGKPPIEALNAGLSLLTNLDLRDEIQSLNIPILYLLGKLDAMVPAVLARSLPKLNHAVRTVVLSKASHALFLSHQNEFLNQVVSFAYE